MTSAAVADNYVLPEPLSQNDFRSFDPAQAKLGQLLFYDKLLSGNRNISCGTCHDHTLATGDGMSLGLGEGGVGLGPDRHASVAENRPDKRVPRNAAPLFNLGHRSISVLFHDGRVSGDDDYGRGFNSPAEEWLPLGLNSIVAVQALFPLTANVEMAGEPEENDLAAAKNRRIDNVWPLVTERIAGVPGYIDLFVDAFDDVDGQGDISIVHVANAIDAFLNSEWRAIDSPFDRFLSGDGDALDASQKRGMALFFGEAQCSTCHAGPLLTDQAFHALGLPPMGPGRVRPFDPYARDVGRMAETDLLEDAYRFKTPALRNVAATGPWGHNGAYASLEGMVRHHLDPLGSLDRWDRSQVVMPKDDTYALTDFVVWEDQREMERLRQAIEINLPPRTEAELVDILSFLEALTDKTSLKGRLGKPATVPSGLPVD